MEGLSLNNLCKFLFLPYGTLAIDLTLAIVYPRIFSDLRGNELDGAKTRLTASTTSEPGELTFDLDAAKLLYVPPPIVAVFILTYSFI